MQSLLVALGSYGDVLPVVALGVELDRRGHVVTLATAEHFAPLVRRAGLPVVSLGLEAEFDSLVRDPGLWTPVGGVRRLVPAIQSALRSVYDFIDLHRRRHPGGTIVAAPASCLGARCAQERLGVPLVTIHVSPMLLRSSEEVPRFPGFRLLSLLPPRMRRQIWDGVDRFVLDPICLPALNSFRREIGLWPIEKGLGRWWSSPDRIVAMFPEWFAPPDPGWPRLADHVGFPAAADLFGDTTELSPALADFLAGGDPPIVFIAGSLMRHAHAFFDASVASCRRLGRRGVLLSGDRDQAPPMLRPAFIHDAYAPLSLLLPRCAAIVHHGGIGTTAAALRAAVPQIAVPHLLDQFDHAARMEALGVGCSLHRRSYRFRGARTLKRLLDSRRVATRCASVAAEFGPDGAIARAASVIEATFADRRVGASL